MTKLEELRILKLLMTEREWLSEAGYSAYNTDIAFNSISRLIVRLTEESEGRQ